MEFCRFLRSVKFVVRSLGRFLGRGVCLWLQRSQGSRVDDTDFNNKCEEMCQFFKKRGYPFDAKAKI